MFLRRTRCPLRHATRTSRPFLYWVFRLPATYVHTFLYILFFKKLPHYGHSGWTRSHDSKAPMAPPQAETIPLVHAARALCLQSPFYFFFFFDSSLFFSVSLSYLPPLMYIHFYIYFSLKATTLWTLWLDSISRLKSSAGGDDST
jgi:hypothetical protein